MVANTNIPLMLISFFYRANQPIFLADITGVAFVTALMSMAIRYMDTAKVVKVE